MNEPVTDRIADAAAGLSVGGAVVSLTIGDINQYLQAGVFIVSIVTGICAALYYWRGSRSR